MGDPFVSTGADNVPVESFASVESSVPTSSVVSATPAGIPDGVSTPASVGLITGSVVVTDPDISSADPAVGSGASITGSGAATSTRLKTSGSVVSGSTIWILQPIVPSFLTAVAKPVCTISSAGLPACTIYPSTIFSIRDLGPVSFPESTILQPSAPAPMILRSVECAAFLKYHPRSSALAIRDAINCAFNSGTPTP